MIYLSSVGCTQQRSINDCREKQVNFEEREESIFIKLETSNISNKFNVWYPYNIIKANYHLVLLMDSLYRYTKSDYIENNIKKNIKWMSDYRNRLCKYYRQTYQLSDSISEFAMADSIVENAKKLWNFSVLNENCIDDIWLIFEQYNEYEKLFRICETEEQKEMLTKEFVEWTKLEKLFNDLYAKCEYLRYWNNTSYIEAQILGGITDSMRAHRDLYKNEYSVLTDNLDSDGDFYIIPGGEYGTDLISAQNLLISSCEKAVENNYCPDDHCYLGSNGEGYIASDYLSLYDNTKLILTKLPQQIDSWCKSRQQWGSSYWFDPKFSLFNTTEVLIKLAHNISAI